MRSLPWVLSVSLLATSATVAQTTAPWVCSTPTERTAPGTGFGCPTEGACDVPFTRDLYTPTELRPIVWLKVHLIVFRADDGSDPAESPADIDGQMATMNADFLPYRIQFTYTWEYIDDSTYRYSSSASSTMKALYANDPLNQCNVFINQLPGGIGTFPWDSDALTSQGGIVLGRDFFSPVHHVLTHEMGHNLGLWHTHHGVDEVTFCSPCYERADGVGGDTTGDFADDTPPGPANFGVCANPGSVDSCSSTPWGETQRENYMSYGSGDGIGCWTLFTTKQGARMHCWIDDSLTTWFDCTVGDDCNLNGISDYCDIRDAFSVDINGNALPDECETVATVGPYNGTGVNLDDLTATPVVVGEEWTVRLIPQAGRGPGTWIVLLRSISAAGPVVDLGTAFGLPSAGSSELLVDPVAFMANFQPPQHGGGGVPAALLVSVPPLSALIGRAWFAQAVVLGDLPSGAGVLDPWFSTAAMGTIGTQ